jgi:L-fuconolactonase
LRIDGHVHFWRYRAEEYAWITAEMSALQRDFLPEELAHGQAPLAFDGSVAVQARQSLAETEWLLRLADTDPRIAAVVGWVGLCMPELPEQLARFAAHPKFRGVRHVIQDEPEDSFMLRGGFLRGLGQLQAHDLTYDLLLFPRHLPVARELVARLPAQRFVLDHLAKPRIRESLFEPWATDLRALAKLPNVSCKLSGMVTEADWCQWRPEQLHPYLEVALEAFGPERLMIGSDWPVCTLAASYQQVIQVVTQFIHRLSPREQASILGQTAAQIYGIGQ